MVTESKRAANRRRKHAIKPDRQPKPEAKPVQIDFSTLNRKQRRKLASLMKSKKVKAK